MNIILHLHELIYIPVRSSWSLLRWKLLVVLFPPAAACLLTICLVLRSVWTLMPSWAKNKKNLTQNIRNLFVIAMFTFLANFLSNELWFRSKIFCIFSSLLFCSFLMFLIFLFCFTFLLGSSSICSSSLRLFLANDSDIILINVITTIQCLQKS